MTWTVDNFSLCRQKNNEFLKSSTCFAGPKKELGWCLHLYPRGDSSATDCISLHPKLIEFKGSYQVLAKFQISIMDDKGRLTNSQSFSVNITNPVSSTSMPKFSRVATLDYIQSLDNHILLDGKLRIHCCVSVTYDETDAFCQRSNREASSPGFELSQLSEDFETLAVTRKYPDVVLVASRKIIPAHKNILACRSSVFSAMFEHELMEKNSGRVEIKDVEEDVLEDLLRFIYTGKSKLINADTFEWKAVSNLLAAADKYDVPSLKKLCAENLELNVAVDNACEILKLADAHNEGKLKKFVIDYINVNAHLVVETPGWKAVLKKYPYVIADIVVATAGTN